MSQTQLDPFCTGGTSPPNSDCDTVSTAALSKVTGPRKRGPVAKRRFQKGRFEIVNDVAYTLYYEDVPQSDSSTVSRRARHTLGRIGEGGLSRRAALRQHNTFMEAVNLKRGSIAPAVGGQTFEDITNQWRNDVAVHLASSTLRQRESHLKQHIIPRFGAFQ